LVSLHVVYNYQTGITCPQSIHPVQLRLHQTNKITSDVDKSNKRWRINQEAGIWREGQPRRDVIEGVEEQARRHNETLSRCGIVIAYSILVHGRPEGSELSKLLRMLQAIYTPAHYYAIHVSMNSKGDFPAMVEAAIESLNLPNVRLIMRRQRVSYSGVSRLLADLISVREMLAWGQWDYWMGLTYGEYPLHPDAELRNFLYTHHGRNFLELEPIAAGEHWKRQRIDQAYVDMGHHVTAVGGQKMTPEELYGVPHHIGPAFGALSRDFSEYLRDSDLALELLVLYTTSQFPDEHFVHTTFMSSPFRDTLERNHLRYWEWDWGRCEISKAKVVDKHGSDYISSQFHPCFLVAEDIHKALRMKGRFFAYKFDTDIDSTGVDVLDSYVLEHQNIAASQCGEKVQMVHHTKQRESTMELPASANLLILGFTYPSYTKA